MTEVDAAAVSAKAPVASFGRSDAGANGLANQALGLAALAVPLLALIAFIGSYARPMPVTDEWFFFARSPRLNRSRGAISHRFFSFFPTRFTITT